MIVLRQEETIPQALHTILSEKQNSNIEETTNFQFL
jgi:hypothetical protein